MKKNNDSQDVSDHIVTSMSLSRRLGSSGVVGLFIAFFLIAILLVQWQRTRLMDKLIESAAVESAKCQIDALASIRTIYTEDVVKVASEHGIEVTYDYKKNDHSIPLPATLTILIGKQIAESGSGARTRLYSPYPFKWRESEGGLRDEFQKEAWQELNVHPESPFSAIVNSGSGRGLRYAVADRMRASCVECHNQHPDSPKRGWKVGDVRGVLEVEIPFRDIETRARQNLLESSALMAFLAIVGGAIVLGTSLRFSRIAAERDERVQQLHDTNVDLDRIVEQRTAELRAIQERFELAVRGSTDGLWDWNVLTNVVYYSPRMKELLGYSENEFPNLFASFEARLHPDDHDWVLSRVHEHLKQRTPYDVEYRLQTKSGEYRWFRARGQAVWLENGDAARMAGSITDVTEEHRLRERFRLAVEASPAALLTVHQDGRILMANSRSLSLFGYTEAELLGQSIEILVPQQFRASHPEHRRQFFMAPVQRAMGADLELLGVRKDGSEFPVKIGLSPVETAEGQAVICGVLDISDQKKAMEAMRQAKEAAESASRAKSSFLANMSHEIRTPMNGIIGMAQLLAQTELRSHQRDYLSTVDESAHILMRLLNDILDFSKIEAGKLELECVDFGVSECVARASQMLVLRAAEKGLEIACRVAPEIPDHLRGDAGRLQQVLVNLLGNAVKFTEAGEIFVNVNLESQTADQVRLHLSVTDTGIGIPADKLNRIFRPFEQAESSTTRRFGGTGLGLTISRQLVEMMHGRMWVESEVGRGSTFHFTAEFGISADQHPHAPVELNTLKDLPVLVVDDNSTNRRILSEILQHWHMHPVLADSAAAGRQALQQAEASLHPIRLILLDHHMPGEDGIHFAESLRGTLSQCPIIMISSGSTPVDVDHGQKYGISRFMNKPVIASELLNEVLRQFGRYTTAKQQSPLETPTEQVQARRVLLVEDNEINRRVALGLLRSRGHQAVVAENGQQAVDTLAQQEFDVVLMDMQMPVMDGYEATAAIRHREHQTGGHIPIVAMTAEALKGDRERCLSVGMDDYVSKPISPAELYRAVERFPAVCLAAAVERKKPASIMPIAKKEYSDARQPDVPTEPHRPLAQSNWPVINWNLVKECLGGETKDLHEFTEVVKNESSTLLADIRRAIEVRDSKLLVRYAHTLKGCVNYFGVETLTEAALALENLGRAESFEGAQDLLATLELEYSRFIAALSLSQPNT